MLSNTVSDFRIEGLPTFSRIAILFSRTHHNRVIKKIDHEEGFRRHILSGPLIKR